MDKTPGPLRACAPIEALDASMYSFVVSKVHTPSVAKQPDSKCFREAPVASFHLTVMMALVYFQCTASSCGNSTLHTFNAAPSSSTASWHACTNHWIYVKVKKGKISVFAIIFNTLYSIHSRYDVL